MDRLLGGEGTRFRMTQPKRDPSTGRFIKPTPSERVAAHVERVNALHPEHDSDCAVNSEPAYPAGECDCGAVARSLPKGFPQAAISKPKPAPSINKQAAAGIIWFIIITGLALIGLIIYLVTH